MNYAIVDTGVVVNVIDYDGGTPLTLPAGQQLVAVPGGEMVEPGSTWDGSNFGKTARVPDPKAAVRDTAIQKLKASVGLTDEEAATLF